MVWCCCWPALNPLPVYENSENQLVTSSRCVLLFDIKDFLTWNCSQIIVYPSDLHLNLFLHKRSLYLSFYCANNVFFSNIKCFMSCIQGEATLFTYTVHFIQRRNVIGLKLTVHAKIKNAYFSPEHQCFSIYLGFSLVWVAEFCSYHPQRCPTSLQYNGAKWHSACGAQSTKNKQTNKPVSLSKSHHLVTQDNPQNVLWAVSHRNYFLSIRKKVAAI